MQGFWCWPGIPASSNRCSPLCLRAGIAQAHSSSYLRIHRVFFRFTRSFLLCGEARSVQRSSACPRAQILLQAAESCPGGGASCLSAEFTWRQMVPDFAALARSVCVALEAWPREVPKSALFTNAGEINLHGPPGLQFTVRPSLPVISLRAPSLALINPLPASGSLAGAPVRLPDDRLMIERGPPHRDDGDTTLSPESCPTRSTCISAWRCTTGWRAPLPRRRCASCSSRQCAVRLPATCSAGPWRTGSTKVGAQAEELHALCWEPLPGPTHT